MRRVEHGQGGQAQCLKVVKAEIDQPGVNEVLIKVAYAGVNRPDVLQRTGAYPPPAGACPYLGLEVSGEIVAIGEQVQQWKVGDVVCALTPGGGYAEYCVTPAAHCLPIPNGMSLLQAAALPETYMTVWTNVFERAGLRPKESLLIHGGSSGIGLTAIQLAKAFDATVLTTVGSAEKAAACVKAGADVVINYKEQDFVKEVKAFSQGQGVNVIVDMVGGSYIAKNLACLALEGRLVQIAFLDGSVEKIDFMPIMLRRLTLTGSTLRARSDADKAQIIEQLVKNVWPLLEQQQALPVIHRVFDLDEVVQAHELMESSQHIGKIMLRVAADD